jgi:hypothetical protein
MERPETALEEEEEQAFLEKTRSSRDGPAEIHEGRSVQKRAWRMATISRLTLELAMAVTIIYLIFWHPEPGSETLRRSPVPRCMLLKQSMTHLQPLTFPLVPRKIYTFHNDPKYTREDMFFNESATLRTLHNWIELSSGRPYIRSWDTN